VRVTTVLAADIYVRNLVTSGALEALAADPAVELRILASDRAVVADPALERPEFAGRLPDEASRVAGHGRLEQLHRVARRSRSRTLELKSGLLPPGRGRALRVAALPGVRDVAERCLLALQRRPRALERALAAERPDLLVLPTGGGDPLVADTIRAARRLGVPTLAVIHNWDGLTSKGALIAPPDHVAVWSEQQAEQARRVHDLRPERVHVIGSPTLDRYFHEGPVATTPFAWPYVLVAGGYAPFDERALVEQVDAIVDRVAPPELRVVYRPHPYRAPRTPPDPVDAGVLRRTLLDPAVAEQYRRSFAAARGPVRFPPLDGYPGLLAGAELVVSPLSTLMLEGLAMGRRVVAVAYGDGIHRDSPALVAGFDHLGGVREIPELRYVDDPAGLEAAITGALGDVTANGPSVAPELGYWVHYDREPYAERLRDLCLRLAAPGNSDG
jgi:hypothetical protein